MDDCRFSNSNFIITTTIFFYKASIMYSSHVRNSNSPTVSTASRNRASPKYFPSSITPSDLVSTKANSTGGSPHYFFESFSQPAPPSPPVALFTSPPHQSTIPSATATTSSSSSLHPGSNLKSKISEDSNNIVVLGDLSPIKQQIRNFSTASSASIVSEIDDKYFSHQSALDASTYEKKKAQVMQLWEVR